MAEPRHEDYEDDFEDDDDFEEGEEEEVEPVASARPAGDAAALEEKEEEEEEEEAAQPWNGLARLPERTDLIELLRGLRGAGLKQLTLLLLGKSSVGKSSLVNSLLGEAAMRVQAFKLQADTEITHSVVRQVEMGDPEVNGLRLKLIDTCGLEDPEAGDTVNWGALSKIAEDIRGVPVDVVLYVDRLDLYRVDPLDKAIIHAISQTFGRAIWRRSVLVLTHSNLPQTPSGTSYDSFADGRVSLLRSAIRGLPLPFPLSPSLPAVLVENSETCPVSPESGNRMLPDGSEWLIALVGEVVDMALSRRRPYKYHPRMSRKPSHRFRWLLPVVVAAEVLFYQRFLRPVLSEKQRRVEENEETVWAVRNAQRRALGLHTPNRPLAEAAWRLEQMYDDD